MEGNWSYREALKHVLPLLDAADLCACMSVSREWNEIARDDYLWKQVCSQKWPSLCRNPPPSVSYYDLYRTFSAPQQPRPLPPANLSFNDLELYFDIWCEDTLIFSKAVRGPTLQAGIKNLPDDISETLRTHLESDEYKLVFPVEPRFTVPLVENFLVSVLACRKDTNKMACMVNRTRFDYIDMVASKAMAYDYLIFSGDHPFVSGIRAWVSVLSLLGEDNDNKFDIFGIEVDFSDAAVAENEILWLLDMMDWK